MSKPDMLLFYLRNKVGSGLFSLLKTKKYFRPHPRGLLIGLYIFREHWSTETFRKEWLRRDANFQS